MSWIRKGKELRSTPEFLQMADIVSEQVKDIPEHCVEHYVSGVLDAVWFYLDEHGWMFTEDGVQHPLQQGAQQGGQQGVEHDAPEALEGHAIIEGMTTRNLARAVGIGAQPVIESMVQVGWLLVEGEDLWFPNVDRRWPNGLRRNREKHAKKAGLKSAASRRKQRSKKTESEQGVEQGVQQGVEHLVNLERNATLQNKRNENTLVGVGSANPPVTATHVIGYWNEVFGTKIRVTDRRKRAVAARAKDKHWVESWPQAIRTCSQSSFCQGEGPQGWVANIDWFLKPDTVTQLLEGKYERSVNGSASVGKAEQKSQRLARNLADFVNDDDEDQQARLCGDDRDPLHIEASCGTGQGSDAGLVEAPVPVQLEDDSEGDPFG
ncbi:MAG: hypothetical protein ACPGPS_04025 [Rubripirellula sp.]